MNPIYPTISDAVAAAVDHGWFIIDATTIGYPDGDRLRLVERRTGWIWLPPVRRHP